MLDKEYGFVAAALRDLTGTDGVYKVIEADEIIEKLPGDARPDKQRLSTIIRDLRDMNYIEVKYLTPDEYCLQTSRRIEELFVPAEEPKAVATTATPAATATQSVETVRKKEHTKIGAKLFAIAFAGSMVGGMIIAALAIILQKFAL